MTSRAPRPSWTRLPDLQAAPDTVLEWLSARFPRVGAEVWRQRLGRGLVTDADGAPLSPEAPFVAGLRVAYYREVADEPPAAGPVRIAFADDHLVVADKPPFLPVVPAGRFVRRCVLYQVEEQLGIDGLTPLHRLDRLTSGLVLLGRRAAESAAYAALFAQRRVVRRYQALARVEAPPPARRWTVRSRIAPGEPFFRMQQVDGPANAHTEVELLDWHRGIGRFALDPTTGKKHQLRLHLAALGYPILGDRFYPQLLPEIPDAEAIPLALVAKRLSFIDPVTGGERRFESAFEVDELAAVAGACGSPDPDGSAGSIFH